MSIRVKSKPTATAIVGDFVRTARTISVKRLVIDPSCKRPTFNRSWGHKSYQDGKLTISPDALAKLVFPVNFDFGDLEEISFPHGATFREKIELDRVGLRLKMKIGAGTIIGEDVKIRHGWFESGEGCRIGARCRIEFSDIGKNVRIGAGTKMHNVKVGDGSEIGPGSFFGRGARTEIGANVRIGEGFAVYDEGEVSIGNGVIIGDGATVYAGLKIGAETVIGGYVELRESVLARWRVETKDAPCLRTIYPGKYSEKPLSNRRLSKETRKIIGEFKRVVRDDYMDERTAICTAEASRAMNADPVLFLYPQLNPVPQRKFVRVAGAKASLIFHRVDEQKRYFGADEIKPEYVAEERAVAPEENNRLMRFAELMPGVLAVEKAGEEKMCDWGDGIHKYAKTPVNETYMLLNFLSAHFGWSPAGTRFLDIGSGFGDVVKVAELFARGEGIELSAKRHALALKHLPKGSSAILRHGDVFERDLSPFDVVYAYMEFPVIEGRCPSYDSPFARKLRTKLGELKSGSIIILGPQGTEWAEIGISYDTVNIGRQILGQVAVPVKLDLPPGVDHYGVFRRK